jgi:tRNA pseudouridine55 synthase
MIFNLYKARGETPLECVQRFRAKLKSEKSFDAAEDKWTYLGRLDPMAEGVLIAATGEDIKKRETLLDMDKEYEFSVLFGFATDTYDVLGKILRVEKMEGLNEMDLIKLASAYIGVRSQKYPPFSSKTVNGAALHDWARKGLIDDIEIPFKTIEIFEMKYNGLSTLAPKTLLGRLLMDISKVQGDFRQHEALVLWKQMLEGMPADTKIFIGNFSARVSSGTYIRGIANDMGNTLGCGACILNIKRIRVGDYKVEDSEK